MYVVGQYPQFLNANWNFLKTVVKKLFEFMHEPYPGVMDMACNTFVRICENCKDEFVKIQKGTTNPESEPFINTMIRMAPEEGKDLSESNLLIFFEALGHCIKAENNIVNKGNQIAGLLGNYNTIWKRIVAAGQQDPESLKVENLTKFREIK